MFPSSHAHNRHCGSAAVQHQDPSSSLGLQPGAQGKTSIGRFLSKYSDLLAFVVKGINRSTLLLPRTISSSPLSPGHSLMNIIILISCNSPAMVVNDNVLVCSYTSNIGIDM